MTPSISDQHRGQRPRPPAAGTVYWGRIQQTVVVMPSCRLEGARGRGAGVGERKESGGFPRRWKNERSDSPLTLYNRHILGLNHSIRLGLSVGPGLFKIFVSKVRKLTEVCNISVEFWTVVWNFLGHWMNKNKGLSFIWGYHKRTLFLGVDAACYIDFVGNQPLQQCRVILKRTPPTRRCPGELA
jgi:hypothetical protein